MAEEELTGTSKTDNLRETLVEQLKDLVKILVIIVKEGVVGLAVIATGRSLARFAAVFSPGSDWATVTARTICDLGGILIFVVLVCKDLWVYLKKK